MVQNEAPAYLTSPELALARAENTEEALLVAAERALAQFLDHVLRDALDGEITRGSVVGYWLAELRIALGHPSFVEIRDELLAALELNSELADDAYTAATLAIAVADNSGATPEERAALLGQLFAHPTPSLLASIGAKVDGWLRRRISRLLLDRIRTLGPEDLTRDNLLGREYEIPETPGAARLVTEEDWREDDRPGSINWRARMRRDIRTAYTGIFGRQIQKQLERYGFLSKRWVSRHDDRVRVTHRHADGQIVGIYETFTVGAAQLRYPGDVLGPPNETVNCRCVLVGVG